MTSGNGGTRTRTLTKEEEDTARTIRAKKGQVTYRDTFKFIFGW